MIEDMCDECKKPCEGNCQPLVHCMTDVEKMKILGNGESWLGFEMVDRLCEVIRTAREKHPKFAEGEWQAIGVISAEIGELVRAVVKGEGEAREISEAFDSVATLWRFILGEHKTGGAQ